MQDVVSRGDTICEKSEFDVCESSLEQLKKRNKLKKEKNNFPDNFNFFIMNLYIN